MSKKYKIGTFFLVILVTGFIFSRWFLGEQHWSVVIDKEHVWDYAFIDENQDISSNLFEQISWIKAKENLSLPQNKDNQLLVLTTTVALHNIKSIDALLLEYHYKYSTKIYINNQECLTQGRNLITPNSLVEKNTILPTIEVEEYWRATKAFIPENLLKDKLVSGNNTITITVSNLKEISSFKPSKISLSILSDKININKSSLKKIAKPTDTFSQSQLPIFVINTNNLLIPDDPKIEASLNVFNKKGVNTLKDSHISYPIKIETRGFTSQSFVKKSYGFTVYNADNKKSAIPLCNLAKAKKWVLHGPYADKSLIRNALTYSLYREMGHYAPQTQFINLVINNNYRGIYVLTEKINTDKDHLNIPEFKIENDSTAQGGYLLEIDRNPWRAIYPPSNDTSSVPLSYSSYSPKSKKLPPAIIKKMQTQFNAFEQQLYENKADKYDYFDVNSFVDYFIISEFTKNVDAYRLSTFLYNKDINSKTPKFYIDPIWDYNFSFGLTDYNEGYNPEGYVYRSTKFVPFWWKKLLADKVFITKLEQRYAELRQSVLSPSNINQQIDSLSQLCEPSANLNFKKWPVLGSTDFWPNYYNGKTYEDEIEYIKLWSTKRLRFLDGEFLKKD